jgi:uncharacterized flavoprotein (TIGR03862 family)
MSLPAEDSPRRRHIVVVGGGPAGLRAAEVAALAGAQVDLFEGKPSVGRKFLVAGKNGLNLTNAAEMTAFCAKYRGEGLPAKLWRNILSEFDNRALMDWASGLAIETFVSKGGKVLPTPINGRMRSTPLLRRWRERLRELGVRFHLSQSWTGFGAGGQLLFSHQGQIHSVDCDATVLALGGGSWPKTGSNGQWTSVLSAAGIAINPLCAANCGWEADWPAGLLEEAEGLPLKNLQLSAGPMSERGELVLTRYGFEGAPIYRLGPALRAMPTAQLEIDFKADQSQAELLARMGGVKRNFVREARRRLKLDPATCALLKHLPDRGPWKSCEQIVSELKRCRIDLKGPRPLAEAISSAGGIRWEELDEQLMLKKIPGVHVAGEMIDWEAPTGGFLLQACFATGTYAGRGALESAARKA